MLRRAVDIVACLALLVVSSPVLLLAAMAVALSSPGPVLYRAERVGLRGRIFRMLKFRTMVRDADRIGPGITARGDPRVTPVGRWLRATKVDELPQLLNVLRGDMTLIGPRAESPRYVRHYNDDQRRLLAVRPGMTGLGQLHYSRDQESQLNDPDRAEEIYVKELLADKLRLDLEYLDRRGLLLDLQILGRTAWLMSSRLVRSLAGTPAERT
jgi:lipopolysaccharide/colanic/teichoic acid biosynthesis glycosyltransferase